jgi:hypothetical protein
MRKQVAFWKHVETLKAASISFSQDSTIGAGVLAGRSQAIAHFGSMQLDDFSLLSS